MYLRSNPTGPLDGAAWQAHAWQNRLQSALLLLGMAGFLALLGGLLWGAQGVLMLLLVGALGVALNPALSPAWVMRLYGATRLDLAQAADLQAALRQLAVRAELPRLPALYYLPSRVLNAFAVGSPAQSAVAVSDGLLRRLDDRELLGVLAHEVSHIRNRDLWVMGLADMMSRATSLLSLFGQLLLLFNLPLLLIGAATINWLAILLLIAAPHLSALAQLALSRTREYDADLDAARLTGDPLGLAQALAKIEQLQGGWMERILLPGRRVPEPSLLRTHPHTADRVRRLMDLARSADAQRPWSGRGGIDPLVGRAPVVRAPRWHVNGLWH